MIRPLAVLPLVALLSCSGGQTATTDGGAGAGGATTGPETRDVLVIASQSDIGNLMSVVQESATDSAILGNLSFPLVDVEFDCSLKRKPGMATDVGWSDDGKVISMTLRDDLSWEDGAKVTPQDIAFTYSLAASPEVGSPRMDSLRKMTEDGRPKIVDQTHVEWHFTEAYDRDAQLSHASSITFVPEHKLKDADRATLRGNPMSKQPLSYGPWRLATYDPGQRIVLEPNPAFTGPDEWKPKLKRVVLRVIPEYSTRLIELEAGNVDMLEGVEPSDADKLRKTHPNLNIVRRGWRFMDYIAWNLSNPLFKDKKVRQALAHAVDLDAIIGRLLKSESGESYGRRAIGTITPELCGVHNDDVSPFPYDKAVAKQMLAEAGWTDTNGDGVLDKDGVPFKFTLTTNQGNPRRAQASVIIQAQLAEIGVKVELETIESNTFFENLRKREYESALSGWSAGLFIDPTNIWHSDEPDKRREFNFTGYSNPEVDALISKGMSTPLPEEAAPIWKELQAKIYEDQPYLFMYWRDELVAIDNRFENIDIGILSAYGNLHRWVVPEDKVKYKR